MGTSCPTHREDLPVRRTPALLSFGLSAALLTSLAACAPGDSASELAEGCTAPGAASDAVSVTGEIGSAPEISFESPLTTEATQRTVVIDGEGEAATDGDIVTMEYAILNGATGEEIESSGFDGAAPVQFTLDAETTYMAGLSLILECTTPGSRITGVIPPAEGFGVEGIPDLGIEGTESIVWVIDLVSIADEPLARAEGEAQEAPEGLPVVELADNGAPTITIPSDEPPAELQIEALIVGDGPVVGDGATVTVHYTGMNWQTGEVFDSSWERGEPTSFPTSGVIEGFRQALVGQTVGSQVIAVIPPELGYGPSGGTPDGSIGAEDTIVFVVDILATS